MVATIDDWAQFDAKWAAALAAENIEEFRQTDFKSSQNAFRGWKDNEPRRKRFMESLLEIFDDCIKAWYTVGIDKRQFAFVNQFFILGPVAGPYMLAAQAAKIVVDDWKNRVYPGAPILHVFEKGDVGQKPRARLEDLGNGVEVREKWSANRGYIYGFQVADLVAGEMRTFRSGIREEDMKRIGRKPLQRIFHKTGSIHFIDAAFLTVLCAAHPELWPRRV